VIVAVLVAAPRAPSSSLRLVTFTRFVVIGDIHIPRETIDVVEAYVMSVLGALGNHVHFVDTFEAYHSQSGEIHCGTNALRAPLEETRGFATRWWDQGVYDPSIDTTYDVKAGPSPAPGTAPPNDYDRSVV
jgi:hypothetical protein